MATVVTASHELPLATGSHGHTTALNPDAWAGRRDLQLGFFCFFCFVAAPHGMQDLSAPTRDQPHAPCQGSPGKT